jgi:hypothetical protein
MRAHPRGVGPDPGDADEDEVGVAALPAELEAKDATA